MKKLQGIYLVMDPKGAKEILLQKLKAALEGGISILQVWNHWHGDVTQHEKKTFIEEVKLRCDQFDVPVLMHDDWKLALESNLSGVHFDEAPNDFDEVKKALESMHIGLTVGNDLEKIAWAEKHQLSYSSFCAMFPSSSVDTCEIVDAKTVLEAQKITTLPIFLSGGITAQNLKKLSAISFSGVAIISGILNSADPKRSTIEYQEELKNLIQNHEN